MRPSQASLHCTRNHISFFRTSWKDGLSKKIALEYDLPCIIGKDIFLFPESMILYLRRKMKDDLSQKKYTKVWCFLQTFWKDCLSKKGCTGRWSFLYHPERSYFFPKNMIYFSWAESGGGLSQEIHGNLCIRTGVRNVAPHRSVKKNQIWSYPAKIHLNVIDVLDWHPTESSSNPLYLHGDLYRRFHGLLSSEEKQET